MEGRDDYPLVVKADGLAAGKGVLICKDKAEARAAVEACFVAREFGDAGDVLITEEYLTGTEVSLLVLCDGTDGGAARAGAGLQAHLRRRPGPQHRRHGQLLPGAGFEQKAIDAAMEHVVEPVVAALRARGVTYRGVLYAGLIVTEAGVKVLEFNCRFGDPETQAVLPRLDSDLLEHCAAAANGELAGAKVLWKPQDCVTVVLASAGYPASSHKGDVISGLAEAAALDDVTVYHAGTALQDGQVVTAGGRVLAVSALGDGFAAARERAYEGVGKIAFDGMQVRPDIAERAVQARAGELDLFPAGFAG